MASRGAWEPERRHFGDRSSLAPAKQVPLNISMATSTKVAVQISQHSSIDLKKAFAEEKEYDLILSDVDLADRLEGRFSVSSKNTPNLN